MSLAIQCGYCGVRNDSEDDRCTRCGRRLHLARPRPAPEPAMSVVSTGAAAAVRVMERRVAEAAAPVAQPDPQATLFSLRDPSPRVVPIFGPVAEPSRRNRGQRQAPRRPSSAEPAQQSLQFSPVTSGRRTRGEMESEIFCDAPVAAAQHRSLAGVVDLGIVVLGWVFALAMYLTIGEGHLAVTPMELALHAGLGLVIGIAYQSLWVIANRDSFGLQFARLRVIHFDGRSPSQRERLLRMIFSWLSVGAAGLGLVWSLMDEESLTWHDHISKTFPSPLDAVRR